IAPFLPLLSVLLWGTLLWAGWTFTLGVLGPWDCDPIFAQAFPSVAAQLAVNQANQDSSLALGSQLTSVVLPTGCDTSSALATFLAHKNTIAVFVGPVNPGYCPAAALLAQGWGKTLFSWVCGVPEGGGVLVPALPSTAHVLLSVMRHFGWAHVAIVSSHQDIWLATARQVAMTLRAYGLPVGLVTSLGPGEQGATEVLKQLCNVDGLKNGRLAFLPYDTLLFTLPYCNRSYPAPGDGRHLQEACGAHIVKMRKREQWKCGRAGRFSEVTAVDLKSVGGRDAAAGSVLAYRTQLPESLLGCLLLGDKKTIVSGGGDRDVSPPFGTTYDAVFLLAHALNSSESHGAGLSGTHLGDHTGSLDVAGFSQRIWTDEKGRRLAQYVILDTDGRGSQLVPTHILDTSTWQVQPLGRAIHSPGGTPPVRDSSCWFDLNTLCMRGNSSIHPSIHPSIHLSICPSIHHSFIKALHVDSHGEWVWLKKFEAGIAPELWPSCLSLLRKVELQRAWRVGCGRGAVRRPLPVWIGLYSMQKLLASKKEVLPIIMITAPLSSQIYPITVSITHQHPQRHITTPHCARGSLEDLLQNEDLRLDWTFKAFLVLDMIRGPPLFHRRGCGICTIGISLMAASSPETVLWLDALCCRSLTIVMQSSWTLSGLPAPGQPRKSVVFIMWSGDRKIYSRGGPGKIVIMMLMEQCWEEAPEDRPNLDQICTQFKSINQGKKTSVADSMLRMLEKYSQNLEDLIQEWTEELGLERQKMERLLSQMLLPSVAEALKMGATVEPEYFDQVTIYFSDTVGFTTISALSEPIEVVGLLNDLYTLFDVVLGNHDVLRLPRRNRSQHAAEITDMALDILSSVGDFRMRHAPTVPIRIRVGPHSDMDLGLREIHVCISTAQTLLSLDEGYKIDIRGQTELKGKGFKETYWLVGKAGFPRPLPTPLDIKPRHVESSHSEPITGAKRSRFSELVPALQLGSFLCPLSFATPCPSLRATQDTPDSWVQNQLVFTERPPGSPGSFNFADGLPGEDRARDWLCDGGKRAEISPNELHLTWEPPRPLGSREESHTHLGPRAQIQQMFGEADGDQGKGTKPRAPLRVLVWPRPRQQCPQMGLPSRVTETLHTGAPFLRSAPDNQAQKYPCQVAGHLAGPHKPRNQGGLCQSPPEQRRALELGEGLGQALRRGTEQCPAQRLLCLDTPSPLPAPLPTKNSLGSSLAANRALVNMCPRVIVIDAFLCESYR
ncbi:hypothetical protein E2I00_018609, partial [Balaenoptera physalus]